MALRCAFRALQGATAVRSASVSTSACASKGVLRREVSVLVSRRVGAAIKPVRSLPVRSFSVESASKSKKPFYIAGAIVGVSALGAGAAYVMTTRKADGCSGEDKLGLRTQAQGWLHKVVELYRDVQEYFSKPSRDLLLPPPVAGPLGEKPRTLVVDLNCLMHSEWKRGVGWRSVKRPGVDLFLYRMYRAGYEIVVFSKGQSTTLDPLITELDPNGLIQHRLFKDHTTFIRGKYVKDLSRLNRDLERTVILDWDPDAYSLQPDNAIPLNKFSTTDPKDVNIIACIPLLEHLVSEDIADVREVIRLYRTKAGPNGKLTDAYNAELLARIQAQEDAAKAKAGSQSKAGSWSFSLPSLFSWTKAAATKPASPTTSSSSSSSSSPASSTASPKA